MFANTRVADAAGDVFTDAQASDTVVLLAKPEFTIASREQLLLSMSNAVTELRNTTSTSVHAARMGDMMTVSRFFGGFGGEPPLSLSVRGDLSTEAALHSSTASVVGSTAFYGPVRLATGASVGAIGNTQGMSVGLDLAARADASAGGSLVVGRDMVVAGDLLVASVEASQMDVDTDSVQTTTLLEAADGRVSCANTMAGSVSAPGLRLQQSLVCEDALISPAMTVAGLVRAAVAVTDAASAGAVAAEAAGAGDCGSETASVGSLQADDLRAVTLLAPRCVASRCSTEQASLRNLHSTALAVQDLRAPVLSVTDLGGSVMVVDGAMQSHRATVVGNATLRSVGAHHACVTTAACGAVECWDLNVQTLRISSGAVGVSDGARIDRFVVGGDLRTTGNLNSARQACQSLSSDAAVARRVSLAALQAANCAVTEARADLAVVTRRAAIGHLESASTTVTSAAAIRALHVPTHLSSHEWGASSVRAAELEAGSALLQDGRSQADLMLRGGLRSKAVESRHGMLVRSTQAAGLEVQAAATGTSGVWANCVVHAGTRATKAAAFRAVGVRGRVDATDATAGGVTSPRLLTTRTYTGQDLAMGEDCDVGGHVGPLGRLVGLSDTTMRGQVVAQAALCAQATVSSGPVLAPNVSASCVLADVLDSIGTWAISAATDTLGATDASGSSLEARSMLVAGDASCAGASVTLDVAGNALADSLVASSLAEARASMQAGLATTRSLDVATDAAVASSLSVGPGGAGVAGLARASEVAASAVTVSDPAAVTSPQAMECAGQVTVATDAIVSGTLAAGQVSVSSDAVLSGNLTVTGLLTAAASCAALQAALTSANVSSLSVSRVLACQEATCTAHLACGAGSAGAATASALLVNGTASAQALAGNAITVAGTAASPAVACGALLMTQDRRYLQGASVTASAVRVQEGAACGSVFAATSSTSDAANCAGTVSTYQMSLAESCQVGSSLQVLSRPLVLNRDTVLRNANDFYVPQADSRVFIAKNLSVIGQSTMRRLQIINTMNNEYSLLETVACDELHTPSLKAAAATVVLGPATLGETSVRGSLSTGGSAAVEVLRGQTGRAGTAVLRGGLSADSGLNFRGTVSAQSITCSDYLLASGATINSLKCTDSLALSGGGPLAAGRLFTREAFVKQSVSAGALGVAGPSSLGEAQCSELVADVIGPPDADGSLVLQAGGLAAHGTSFGPTSASLPDPSNTAEGSMQHFMLNAVDLAEFRDIVMIYNSLYRVISQGTLSALNDTPVIMQLTDLLLVSAGDYSLAGEELYIRLQSLPQQLGAQGIFLAPSRQGLRPTHVYLNKALLHLVRYSYYTPAASPVPVLALTLSGLSAQDLPDPALRPLTVLMGCLRTPDRLALDAGDVVSNLTSPGKAYPALSGTAFGGRIATFEVDAIVHASPSSVYEVVPAAGARSQPAWLCPVPAPKGTRPRVVTFDAADFFGASAPPTWDGGAKFFMRFTAPQPLLTALPTDPLPPSTIRIARSAYSDKAVYFDHQSIIQYDKVLRKYLTHVSVGLSNVQCPCNLSNVVAYEITADMGMDKVAASLYFPHSTYLPYDLNKDAASRLLNQATYDPTTKTVTLHHTTAWAADTSASPSMPTYQPATIAKLGTRKQAAQTYEQVYNAGSYTALDVTEGGVTYPEVHQCFPIMPVRRAVADAAALTQYSLAPTALKFAPDQFFHREYLGVQVINYLIREEDLPVISLYTPTLPEDPPLHASTAPLSSSMKNNKLKAHYNRLYHVINIPVSGISLGFNAPDGSFLDVTKDPPGGTVSFTTGEQPYSSVNVPPWDGKSYSGGSTVLPVRYVTGASTSQQKVDDFSTKYMYTFTISGMPLAMPGTDPAAGDPSAGGSVDLTAALSDVEGQTYLVKPAPSEGFWKLVKLGTETAVLTRAATDAPNSANSRPLTATEESWFLVDLSHINSALGVVDLFLYMDAIPVLGGTTTLELSATTYYYFKPISTDPTANPFLFSSSYITRNRFDPDTTVIDTDTSNAGRAVSIGDGQFGRYFIQFNYVVGGGTQAVSDMHLYLQENISKNSTYLWVGGNLKSDIGQVYAATFFIMCDASGSETPVPAGLQCVPTAYARKL